MVRVMHRARLMLTKEELVQGGTPLAALRVMPAGHTLFPGRVDVCALSARLEHPRVSNVILDLLLDSFPPFCPPQAASVLDVRYASAS